MGVEKPAETGPRAEAKERLLVQAAQKDPSRFVELYENNFERVYAFIVRRVRDRSLAEDLTSDVFHNALAALPNFDCRGIPFAAWLFRIASNLVTDQWKRAAKEVVEDPPPASTNMNLEEIEQRAHLFRLVEQLPRDQRRVVGMRFAEGKSIREIAQQLGRSEGAVKQLQFRGLQALRAQLNSKQVGKYA